MRDEQCVAFLQWALPQIQMRWPGFRRVRAQACKRIARRHVQLGLATVDDYRYYLAQHADEWQVLDACLRISISRFYRDKLMFAHLEQAVLPVLARQALASGHQHLDIWCVGCGNGEEPYTLAIIWHLQLAQQFPALALRIVASDADPAMCRRAEQACYAFGSVKNLPAPWRAQVFTQEADRYCLKPAYRRECTFLVQDIRETMPPGRFDLVLCRNLVFTYFDEALQRETLARIRTRLKTNGALVIGIHENLPAAVSGFAPWQEKLRIYRKTDVVSGLQPI